MLHKFKATISKNLVVAFFIQENDIKKKQLVIIKVFRKLSIEKNGFVC